MKSISILILACTSIVIGCTNGYRGLETDKQTKPIEVKIHAPGDSVYVSAAKVLTSYNFPIIQTDAKLGSITTDFMKYEEGDYGFLREVLTREKDFEVQIGILVIPKGDSSILRATGRVKYQKKEWFGNHSTHIEPADKSRHNRTRSQIETIAKKIAIMAQLAAHPESIASLDPFNSIDRASSGQRFEFDPVYQSQFIGRDCKSVTELYNRSCDIIRDTACYMFCKFVGTDCASIYVCQDSKISRVVLSTKDLKSLRSLRRSIYNRFSSSLNESFGQSQPFDTVLAGFHITGQRWLADGYHYALYEREGYILIRIWL